MYHAEVPGLKLQYRHHHGVTTMSLIMMLSHVVSTVAQVLESSLTGPLICWMLDWL